MVLEFKDGLILGFSREHFMQEVSMALGFKSMNFTRPVVEDYLHVLKFNPRKSIICGYGDYFTLTSVLVIYYFCLISHVLFMGPIIP